VPHVVPYHGVLAVRSDGAARIPDACRCACAHQPLLAEDIFRLKHLYACEGLSTYRIAQLTGLDRQRVARQLRQAGVPLRPRGAGGTRSERRRGDPPDLAGLLAELYINRHLTSAQVGEALGIPGRTVRDRLRRYGIRTRTRGGWERKDRRVLPAGVLADLYSRDGLSADDVGRKLDTSRNVVLRSAHDLGFPVRIGGAVPQSGPDEIELIDALYADDLVAGVLAEHNIPRVPAGGPIWQRFPEPIPLTRQLVADLYAHCGVGLHHIELLTGQPAQTARGFIHRIGMTPRHPGGRSPFLRRWRTGSSQDENPSSGTRGPRTGHVQVPRPRQAHKEGNNRER